MRHLFSFVLVALFAIHAYAQDFAAYTNTSEIISENTFGGPICKGFTDVNGDCRDDIVRVVNGTKIVVDLQSNHGELFQSYVVDTIEGDAWTISIGDLDNDGFANFFVAGNENGMTLYETGNDPTEYKKTFESINTFFAQGSNFVDMNNDGWLDVFICDDNGHSEIFLNDGAGGLVYDTSFIDMRTDPVSDNSGNYASEWTDIDGDGDLDLYIAKCRLGVDEFTDPRRINQMFINDNGNFREVAEEWGVAIGAQTWTANFGDIDNDGDQDLFMINHEYRSQLFENINNERYQEIPLLANGNEIITQGYQSSFADFNNDGFLDILIVGGGDRMLLNDGNKSFIARNSPIGTSQTQSFALGDANHDGFLDIMASYRSLGAGVNGDRDRLWTCLDNGNHWITFALVGNESNKSGVGAKVELFSPIGTQTRIIQSGVGYGITNSLTARFGIDDFINVDSVRVTWPSGIQNTYDNINADTHYIIHEGECISELAEVEVNETRLDCLAEETELTVSGSFSSAVWNTGDTGLSLTATEPGLYTVVLDPNSNCPNHAQTILVRGPEELEKPQINLAEDVKICVGQPLEVGVRQEGDWNWSTGDVSESIVVSDNGQYFATNLNQCDTIDSDVISIEFIDPSNPGTFEQEFTEWNERVTLTVPAQTVNWYSDPNGMDLLESTPIYQTGELFSDTVFYFDYIIQQDAPVYVGGADMQESINEPNYSFENVNGSLWFVVDQPSILKSFSVNSNAAGERRIIVENFITKDTVHDKIIFAPQGISEVQLDFVFDQGGSFEIKTDVDVNTANFGSRNPEFSIIEGDLAYPYNVADIARISRSSFGRNTYHYFFDWKMELLIDECFSDIVPFVLDFNPSTSAEEVLQNELVNVFPNPAADQIKIQSEKSINQIKVFNSLNQLIETIQNPSNNQILNISDYRSGHYLLKIEGKGIKAVKAFVKL